MSLLDRLRPKWQSTDSEVRAQAVRELPKGEVDLLTALAQQDPDPRVRRIALKKLESPRLLLEIAETDGDESLRSFARKRARQRLVHIACDERDLEESKRALALLTDASDRVAVAERAHFPEVRAQGFDMLTDDDALFEIVRKAKDPEVRVRALARITSPQTLKKVVLDEASGDLALAALARIDDLEALESVFDQRTLPRSVRRQAFSKLEKLVSPDHPIKARARQERFQELSQHAEGLADARMPSAANEVASLRESWAAIESEGAPDPKTAERFRAALEAIVALAPSSRAPKAAAIEPKAVAPETPDSRAPLFLALLERVESLDDKELASVLEPLAAEWEELVSQEPPGSEVQSRFRRALKSASARLKRIQASEAGAREAAVLVERAETASRAPDLSRAASELRSLEREWSRLADPVDAALQDRFCAALSHAKSRQDEARMRQEEAEQRNLRDLEARIQLMETLAASENLSIKDADRVLKEAQDFLKGMGPLPKSANRKKARKRLVDAREQLFKRTQDTRELEEWKRWANVDVQQTLIDRIEKLKQSNDLPKVAKELRQIHEDWKKAGAATPDKAQELWHRYKAIRDEIKARCEAFFENQSQERVENQKLKEALCVQVESLKESQDWNRTADAIKEIQLQWKKIGPVPQETGDALWKRFRAACDFFFDRRKQGFDHLKSERDSNLAAKVGLCERAEAIQDATDWAQVANELKRLQSEWREVGAVPRKKSDEVWKRFRTACDRFFDRYKRRDEVEIEERLKKRQSLIDELVALGPSKRETNDGLAERVQGIWNAWKSAGPLPEAGSEIVGRFESEVGALLLDAPAAFIGTELDPAVSAKKRGKIVARLESIVDELEDRKPAAEPLESLAQRLKDALASNTIGGGGRREPKLDWRQASDEVSRLRATWAKTAPVPGEEGRALAERFERACRSFFERRPPERPRSRSSDRATLSRP
ncbi:MAG TPA: DUF349 domain-containing protein [Vicinamibacteria bacterium]|nr:DUF349 domain-containing protein [Vicinamibacteria bacterium]